MKQILPIATFAVCLLSTALKASEVPVNYTAMVDTTKVEVAGLFEGVLTENTTLKTSLEVLEQRFTALESLVRQGVKGDDVFLNDLILEERIRYLVEKNQRLKSERQAMRELHPSAQSPLPTPTSKPCSPRDRD